MTNPALHGLLTFERVKNYANEHGIEFERDENGYAYWHRADGGAVVGHAETLREAFYDLDRFMI